MSKLNQSSDIQGSYTHNALMVQSNEPLKIGSAIPGQTGVVASLSGIAPNITVTGLTGMLERSSCRTLSISGAANITNNGTFIIVQYLSPTSVIIYNTNFVGPELNNGNLTWIEFSTYSLEDDNNYHRTDRANIKGTTYYAPIPQYVTCVDQANPINTSLANIAGHTTDAKALVDNIRYNNLNINTGDTFATLISAGNLKHADAVDITGVPIYNGSNDYASFVSILRDGYATPLSVLSGIHKDWVVYGRTRVGSSISPNSVEIEFRIVPQDKDFTQSLAYIWEAAQYKDVEVIIGYRISLDNLSEVALRKLLIDYNSGSVSSVTSIPTLEEVLTAGDSGNGLNIININDILSNNLYIDDGYISNNLYVSGNLIGGNALTVIDGYFTRNIYIDGYINNIDILNHSYRHEKNGADSIEISNLGTSENNTTLVLKPNGIGGVNWQSVGGGNGDIIGPGYSIDNAIARWDGYDGYNIQNSNIFIDDFNNITGINSITAIDGYFENFTISGILNLEGGYLIASDLDGYIKLDSVTVENLITIENNTGKLLAPDGIGGVIWITPPSLDGYITIDDLAPYAKITDLDGYLTIEDLDGYIKIDAVTVENLTTIENDTGKLLAPDGIGGVTWITPPSLDGYITIDDLDPYAKITDLDGYLTMADLDGYIKLDSVTVENLITIENDTGKLLAPDGIGGVTWITPPSLDGYITIDDLAPYAKITDLDGYLVASDLDPYAKIIDLDGYLTMTDLDGYIKIDSVTVENLATIENDTGKLLAPDGIGGVLWITPPSLDGYITIDDLAPYAKITDLDGYLTIEDLDGYIKLNSVTVENLTTIENNEFLVLRPNGVGGVKWSNDGYLITPDTVTDNAVVRWNGIDGYSIENSSVIIDDNNNISGINTISSSYLTTTSNFTTFDFENGYIIFGDGYVKSYAPSLEFYISNTSELTLNMSEFYPTVSSGLNLGSALSYWNDAFINSLFLNGVISGATEINSSYFITTPNDATFNFGNNDIVIGDGYIKASGASLQTYIGNTSETTLTNNSLYPTTNNGLDLGSISNYWEDGYITNIRSLDGYFENNLITRNINIPNVYDIIKNPSGFPNRTDSTITVDDDGYIFTIAPTSSSFDFYIKGVKYTKTTPQTVSWTNVEGIHFFYFNSSEILTHTTSDDDWIVALKGDGAVVAAIYWDYINTTTIYLAEERHGFMDPVTHAYLHSAFGAQWISGGQLTNIIADGNGSLDSHAQFGLTTTSIADEDNVFLYTDGVPQEFDPIAYIPIYYQLGIGQTWRMKTADTFPFIQSGSAGYTNVNGLPAYNLDTGGTWSLAPITNNNYFLCHYYAGNDLNKPIFGVLGQNLYLNVADARTGAEVELHSIGTVLRSLSKEFTPLGTVIFQGSTTYANTPGVRIRSTTEGLDYIDFRGNIFSGTGASSGGVTDHGNLTGLTDVADHPGYLTLDGLRTMVGPLLLGSQDITGVNGITAVDGYFTNLSISGKMKTAIDMDTHSISNITTIGSSYLTTTTNDATFNFGSNDIVIGDGYIKAQTSLSSYIGFTRELELNNSALYPYTNIGLDLGTSSFRFNNVYGTILNIDGSGTFSGTLSGITTIGSSYLTTTPNDATFNFGSNDVVIGDGYIKASGASLQTYIGNISEITLTNNSLYPTTNNSLDLGSISNYWEDGYISNLHCPNIILGEGSVSVSEIELGNQRQVLWSDGVINSWTSTPIINSLTVNSIINFDEGDDPHYGSFYFSHLSSIFNFSINSVDKLSLNTTELYPTTDSNISLGTTSLRWSNFFSDDATIAIANINTLTINTSIIPDTDGGANIGTTINRFNTIYSKSLNISGNISSSIFITSSDGNSSTIYLGYTGDTNNNFISCYNSSVINASYMTIDVGNSSVLELYNNVVRPASGNISLGDSANKWSNIYSTYFTTTANDATFNFGSNDIVIGDGYVKASGASLATYIGGLSKLTLNATEFYPTTDSNISLGITANRWSNFFSDDATIAIANINTLTINTVIIPDTDGGANIGTAINRISQVFAQQLNLSNNTGNCYCQIQSSDTGAAVINFGDGYDSNIGQIYYNNVTESFIFTVNNATELTLSSSELRPVTNNGLNLGSSSYRWGTTYNDGIIDGYQLTENTSSYLRLKTKNGQYSYVDFASGSKGTSGQIAYDHTNDYLRFYINKTINMGIDVSSIYPYTNELINLGKSSNYFKDGYISNFYCTTINSNYLTTTPNDATFNFGSNDIIIGDGYIKASGATLQSYIGTSSELTLSATALYPTTDRGLNLGVTGTGRWDNVYAFNTTITTSDEREKQDILPINDEVLNAWEEISLIFYRWIESVNKKKENARLHSGIISQRIKETFAKHGLDAHQYGLFCYDEWPEKIEKTIKKLEDGTEKIIEKIIPAGNAYGIRSTECLFVEAAYQRRRSERIEERLNKLEKFLKI